jgi:hypothetical protein
MRHVWRWLGILGIAYFVFAGIGAGYQIYVEGWEPTLRELRAALPLYMAAGVVGLVLIVRKRRQLRREERRNAPLERRMNGLLEAAARKQQEGDGREADRLLDEYRDLFILRYGLSPEEYLQGGGHDASPHRA